MTINEEMPYEKLTTVVDGVPMAYVDTAPGDRTSPPVVFLHGNPTSSYLWRNVIPHVAPLARCIAPDLIGFGDSGKLPGSGRGSYRFVENQHYMDELFSRLELDALGVVFVLHDWGSGLGFDWARRHPTAVRGIAYLEANVAPRSWSQLGEQGREIFRALRTEEGERMALEDNFFIERGIPGGVVRSLSKAEMAEYRRPFQTPGEDRRPTLTWPREIPFDGEPADVHGIVAAYAAWLPTTAFPKLLIDVSDGDTLTGDLLEFARTWPNQTEVRVQGRHFAQEDSPDEIGQAIASWLANDPNGRKGKVRRDPTGQTFSGG